MLRWIIMISILIGSIALAVSFGLMDTLSGLIASLVIGGLWLILAWFRQHWAASFGFPLMAILTLVVALQEQYALLAAVALTASLTAWDLARFSARLLPALQDANWQMPARRHVRRLLIVNGVALSAALAAMSLQFGGDFYLLWLVGFVAITLLVVVILLTARFTHS